jgi:hypothetical protein
MDRATQELRVFDEYAIEAIRRMRVEPGQRTLGGCPPGEWQWMQCENAATVTAMVLEGSFPRTRLVVEFELAYLPGVHCEWGTALWSEEEKEAGASSPTYDSWRWLSLFEDISTAGPRRLRGRVQSGDRILIAHRSLLVNDEIPPRPPARVRRITPDLATLRRTWPGAE